MIEEEIIAEEALAAMVEEHNGSGHGFVLGIMVGVIAGAAAATLFAPTSGEEMRQRIADEASPIRGHSEQAGSDEAATQESPVDRMRSMLARVRTRVQEATEEGQQAAQEAEAEGQAHYEELTHQEERQA